MEQPPAHGFRSIAGAVIGLCSGLAGVGGGILTNIVIRNADAQEYRTRRRSGCSGEPTSHPRRCIRIRSLRADTARQWGEGGWFSELENEKSGSALYPVNGLKEGRAKFFEALEQATPAASRTPIADHL